MANGYKWFVVTQEIQTAAVFLSNRILSMVGDSVGIYHSIIVCYLGRYTGPVIRNINECTSKKIFDLI